LSSISALPRRLQQAPAKCARPAVLALTTPTIGRWSSSLGIWRRSFCGATRKCNVRKESDVQIDFMSLPGACLVRGEACGAWKPYCCARAYSLPQRVTSPWSHAYKTGPAAVPVGPFQQAGCWSTGRRPTRA